MSHELETIVAPATPVGRSALAIVRIDGPRSAGIVEELSGVVLEERRATRVDLADGEGPIDEAVAVRYVAPRSYTGNDLVEVTLHGSSAVIERLLRAVVERGGRLAEAGEFTERSVLNGKIDLVQAEAIGDLIASRTGLQARVAIGNLRGSLSEEAERVRSILVELLTRWEAALDFADEGYQFIEREEAQEWLAEADRRLEQLERSFRRGAATRSGVTAVLAGRPNAGKSTLLNFLCGSERAIVTPIPGTTRDLLRETIELGGLPVTLVDTAGLRETEDVVESVGVSRAREAAAEAQIILYLIDATVGESGEDREFLRTHPGAIVLQTKADLAAPRGEGLAISVPAHQGLDALLGLLDGRIREEFAAPEGSAVVVNERQRGAVREARDALRAAADSIEAEASEEIVAVDLRRAARSLGLLTGAITTDEILASIFAKFCIGK